MIAVLLLLAQSLSQQGAEAMRENRFADAERIYQEMAKAAPRDERAALNLALAQHSGGKFAEASAGFQRFLNLHPEPGPVHLMLGAARLKLQQPCDAIPALETARVWQASKQVMVELADAYFGCKRYEQAAEAYSALLPDPKALQGAGLSYARLGRQNEARAMFAKLERLPPTPALHELLAEAKTLEGNHAGAVTELDNALKLSPNDHRLQRLRARALWRAGRYGEAKPAFEALASRWSQQAEFNFERGDTVMRLEGAEAALPYLRTAARQAPGLIAARAALGRALLELGMAAESIPHLQAASAADATVWLPLSRAYKATGRPTEAARALKQYKEKLSPNQN